MKKTKYNGIEEYLYSEKLDNGLEIYIVPNNNVEKYVVSFVTRFGGSHNEFMLDGQAYKKPTGIAHYLEHLLFEMADGENITRFFKEYGTNINAATTKFFTKYNFVGVDNLPILLEKLLDFVQAPYFTDENIAKERGVIEQEIKMRMDRNGIILFNKTQENLFHYDLRRTSISGTLEDVAKITKEDLYDCYNAFYNPNNMFLVVTGNVDPQEVISLVKQNQKTKVFNNSNPPIIIEKEEPDEVVRAYEEIDRDVSIPHLVYAIKVPFKNTYLNRSYLGKYFQLLFSETSLFAEEVIQKRLALFAPGASISIGKNHYLFTLECDTNNVDDLIKHIDETLKNTQVSEADFKRKTKIMLSTFILSFDYCINLNNDLVNQINDSEPDFNFIKRTKEMNFEDFTNFIKTIDTRHKAIVVMRKK